MAEKKFTVKEFAELISGLNPMEVVVVCDVLSGQVTNATKMHIGLAEVILKERLSDLSKAILNWNLDFPAHKDDAILALLEELLEDVLCQKQLGTKEGEGHR